MTTGEQLHRMTENVYRNIIDGFTPEVRTLIAQGKVYDKALQGVTQAAKEYFDAIVRVGEVASNTKGSRQLGQSLLQIAETYRQIEAERDAVVHCLRKELLVPMEAKLDQEWKYISQNQKSYMNENKAKSEGVDKTRSEVKKIQKKTQKNHSEKYLEKEQKSLDDLHQLTKQLLSFRSQSLREAWCEQRKRYAFVVERYCASIKSEAAFYGKAQSVLQYRLPKWSESCEKPYKLPEECEEMLSMSRPVSLASQEIDHPLSVEIENQPTSQNTPPSQTPPMTQPPQPTQTFNLVPPPQSIQPQQMVPPLQMALPQQMAYHPQTNQTQMSQQLHEQDQMVQQMGYTSSTLPHRGKAAGGLRYSQSVMYGSAGSKYRPQVQRHSSDTGDDNKMTPKVRGLYNHLAAGETQLGFQEGDIIGLVGPHNNGWYFGHNYRTKKNGWFPISFTQPLDNDFPHTNGSVPQPPTQVVPQPNTQVSQQTSYQNSPQMLTRKGLSVSSENLARTNGDNYPSPDYSVTNSPHHTKFFGSAPPPPSQTQGGLLMTTSQQSLHSHSSSGSQLSSGSITPQNSLSDQPLDKPSTPTHPPPPPPAELDPNQPAQGGDTSVNPILTNVQLRKTVTDDRSAPQIPKDYSLTH